MQMTWPFRKRAVFECGRTGALFKMTLPTMLLMVTVTTLHQHANVCQQDSSSCLSHHRAAASPMTTAKLCGLLSIRWLCPTTVLHPESQGSSRPWVSKGRGMTALRREEHSMHQMTDARRTSRRMRRAWMR